ncbi:MAG: tetratricopeptide repeat protein [Pseudomonadota bacterium]
MASPLSTLTLLALLALLALPAVALAGDPAVSALVAQANAADGGGDRATAELLVAKALAADPDAVDALMLHARFLLDTAHNDPDQEHKVALYQAALADYQHVLEVDPGHAFAGAAITNLLQELGLAGEAVATEGPECPPEAEAAFEEAENAFSAGRWADAEAAYLRATEACPVEPTYWTYLGDARFARGDLAGAEAGYRHAIEVDPCFWVAHRFLGDVRYKQGDMAGAWDSSLRAVACNPTYAMGWASVQQLAGMRGLSIADPGVDWSQVDIEMPEGVLMMEMPEGKGAEAEQAGMALTVYRMGRMAFPLKDPDISPMELERQRILIAVEALGDDALTASYRDPFLQVLQLHARAAEAGLLDASIYTLHITEPLVPEFMAWRTDHVAEMERFIGEFILVGADVASAEEPSRREKRRAKREARGERRGRRAP